MGKPYSVDLRERIVEYVEQGHSARAAAGVFGVSASSAVRFATAQRDRGSVALKPQGHAPGTAGKLAVHMDFLLERVKSKPDVTLQELADGLREARGVKVQLSSIPRALIRAKYSYKKGLVVQERDRPDVRVARHLWTTQSQARMRAEPHRLVFLDETSVKTTLTRLVAGRPSAKASTGQRLSGSGAPKPSSPARPVTS